MLTSFAVAALQVEYDDGDIDAGLQISEYEVVKVRNQRLVRVLRGDSIAPELYLIAPPVEAATFDEAVADDVPITLAEGSVDRTLKVADRGQTTNDAEQADEHSEPESASKKGRAGEGDSEEAVPKTHAVSKALTHGASEEEQQQVQEAPAASVTRGSNDKGMPSQPAQGSAAPAGEPQAPTQPAAPQAEERQQGAVLPRSSQHVSAASGAAASPRSPASNKPASSLQVSWLGLSIGSKSSQTNSGQKPTSPSLSPAALANTASTLRRPVISGPANGRLGEVPQKSTRIGGSSSSLFNSLAGSPLSGSGSEPAAQKTTRLAAPANLRPSAARPKSAEQPQPSQMPNSTGHAPRPMLPPGQLADQVQTGPLINAAATQANSQGQVPAMHTSQQQPQTSSASQMPQQRQLPAQPIERTVVQAGAHVARQQLMPEPRAQAGRQPYAPAGAMAHFTPVPAPNIAMSLSASRGKLHWMPDSPASTRAAPNLPLYREAPLQVQSSCLRETFKI